MNKPLFGDSNKSNNRQPIVLGLEHGFTYGGSAGDAFLLNAAVASPNRDAQVDFSLLS